MTTTGNHFELPSRIEGYLATLSRLYARDKDSRLQEIIVNSTVSIHEQWSHDNWNGGIDGHALTLTIPEDLFLEIVGDKGNLATRICRDINSFNSVRNENIDEVFIEMETTESGEWRESSGLLRPRISSASIPPQSLTRIWGSGHVRVFLSHKAEYKEETSKLKEWLGRCGIACFVAHEDIQPTQDWQREIEYALRSMDAVVALLTEGFHQSNWTDQELGIALGRGVPVVAVCLDIPPYGFVGKHQGLRGCSWNKIPDMAARIYEVLHKRLPDKSRLFDAALAAYADSPSFYESLWTVENALSRFQTPSAAQIGEVIRVYGKNPQNKGTSPGRKRLKLLLEGWTGRKWVLRNNDLVESDEMPPLEDLPF